MAEAAVKEKQAGLAGEAVDRLRPGVPGPQADGDDAEVGQPGFWTHRRELGVLDHNFVAGKLVRPGFNFGKFRVQPGGGVFSSVTRWLRHGVIVAVPTQAALGWGTHGPRKTASFGRLACS